MSRLAESCHGVVAIDGKVLRRSFDTASAKSPLHMASAWGCEQRLVPGQVATAAKSNEITTVPKLLGMLSLEDCIVTVDQGGDYALAPKGNQGTLHADASRHLDDPEAATMSAAPVVEGDHGRIETRIGIVATDIDWLRQDHRWPGPEAIGKITRTRETPAKTTVETAYYLLGTPLSPERFAGVARAHWGIEDRLHWVLDVVMNEDQARNRLDNGPENLAILRHVAPNLIAKEKSKIARRRKILKAGWNNDFLATIMTQF